MEKGIAAVAARLAPDELVDWDRYRQCTTCRAPGGQACFSLSSRIIDGRPDGPAQLLQRPHASRRLRSRG